MFLFLCKTTEVIHTNFLPFLGIFELMLQAGVNFLPALLVDAGLGLVPDTDKVLNLFYTTCVAVVHFLKYGATAFQSVAPWHSVEPQQVAFRTGVDVVVQCAVRLSILCCGIRTCMCAVETNAVVVGLMVVNRAPLQGNVCIVPSGSGP